MKGVWFRALGSGFGLPSWRLTLNPKPHRGFWALGGRVVDDALVHTATYVHALLFARSGSVEGHVRIPGKQVDLVVETVFRCEPVDRKHKPQ